MRRLVALPAVVALIACGGGASDVPARGAAASDTALLSAQAVQIGGFTTAQARYEPWRDTWRVPGRLTLDPLTTQPLGSIVEGRVMDVRVLPGDRVREGEVLVAIHTHEMIDARQAIVTAKAMAMNADSAAHVAALAAARGERLLAAKAMSEAEVERLRAASVAAVAQRDEAHAELARATEFLAHLIGEGPVPSGTDEHAALIRAPFDGVVASRSILPGQVATVGQQLLVVSRPSSLALVLQLPEEALGFARAGSPVRFSVAAFPGRMFDARVTRVAPMLDSISRTLEVIASVSDPRAELKPELAAAAEVVGGDGARALTVPAGAIQDFDGDTVVVRALQQGEGMLIEAVKVRVGRRSIERAEILAGLDSAARVIVGGASTAKAELLRRRAAGEP